MQQFNNIIFRQVWTPINCTIFFARRGEQFGKYDWPVFKLIIPLYDFWTHEQLPVSMMRHNSSVEDVHFMDFTLRTRRKVQNENRVRVSGELV